MGGNAAQVVVRVVRVVPVVPVVPEKPGSSTNKPPPNWVAVPKRSQFFALDSLLLAPAGVLVTSREAEGLEELDDADDAAIMPPKEKLRINGFVSLPAHSVHQ
jgi:hypothetical protein